MDIKIKNDIKALIKMGLSQEMAELIACANNGKPELVEDTAEYLKDEQSQIIKALAEGGFQPYVPTPVEGIVVSNAIEDAPAPIETPKEEKAEEPKRATLPMGHSLVWSA
jgi:hypothetical protein